MWKPEHRLTADRRSLRYPSDLSDAEWVLIAPMVPPARRGGRRRSVDVREVLNAIFYVLSTAANGRRCRKISRPKARRIPISCCGIGTAPWIAFTTHFMSRPAKQPDGRLVLRLQSSTPKAARQRKKGVCTRPAGL